MCERERERELGTGILFEEPNPTGSRPRGLIGLYRKWQRAKSRDPNQLGSIGNGKQERERGANTSKVHPKSQKTLVSRRIEVGRSQAQGRGGGRQGLHCGEANPNQKLGFIQEGNRAPVSKATHSRPISSLGFIPLFTA